MISDPRVPKRDAEMVLQTLGELVMFGFPYILEIGVRYNLPESRAHG